MRIKLDASTFIKVMKETVLNVKSEMVSNVVRTVALTQIHVDASSGVVGDGCTRAHIIYGTATTEIDSSFKLNQVS